MPVYRYRDKDPRIDPAAFVAPDAAVVGDVTIGPEASVWFNAVIRGDSSSVRVGARTNVQDGAVLHTDPDKPCWIGEDCTIGHRAIVHACTVGNGCLIGMGAILLSGSVIGDESLVAAGALVPEGKEFPARSLLMGAPARLVRELSTADVDRMVHPSARNYLRYVRGYSNLRHDGPKPIEP